MQLVSYGAQDVYISGNPQITFWKILYKRHTNFAVESIEVTFNGQADFNKRVTAVINRNADLMYKTYLQVVLPECDGGSANASTRWVHYIGHQLINQVEVEIGGQRIDRQYGDWMQIWTQLATEAGSVRALNSLIGQTADLQFPTTSAGQQPPQPCSTSGALKTCGGLRATPAKTLYIPLQFWFCRNPGVAIPLIALQYHEVRINVEFNPMQLCRWTGTMPSSGLNTATTASAVSLAAASLYVDYCYLDTEERRRFAQQSHEYLIEQVQYTGAESITSSSNKIQLNFNHPVKELFWVVQRDSFVDCATTADVQKYYLGIQPFNYSDDFDVSLAAMTDNNNAYDVNSGASNAQDTIGQGGAGADANVTLFLLGKVLLESDVRCEGGNPVEVAKLQLNGQDRFTEREGSYFDKVQPYQHHCRTPSTGINCYSFALRPEEHQPSGTCNFSRIDKATLQLTVSVSTVSGNNTAQVRVYALNYNVLRVMSGMGGLAYSN